MGLRRVIGTQPISVRLVLPLMCASALMGGCASAPVPSVLIHESAQGSVYLEQLPRGAALTSHPIALRTSTVTRVLSGVRVQREEGLLQSLLTGKPTQVIAFSEQDVEFLTPLLVTTLSQASPDQLVRFRVTHPTSLGTEATGGTLFARDLSLYFTLTQFRVEGGGQRTSYTFHRQFPDSTGLRHRKVRFVPEGVERLDRDPESGPIGPPHLRTLVIDYTLLDKLPEAWLSSTSHPTPDIEKATVTDRSINAASTTSRSAESRDQNSRSATELQSMKELMIKKDLELEALTKQLRLLQRRPAEKNVD